MTDPVRRLAVLGLPGAAPLPALDEAEAEALAQEARARRFVGPLLLAEEHGDVTLGAEAHAQAVEAHRAAQLWCLKLERRLLQVEQWFEEAGGVDHLVVKGPAIAHLDEVDPSMRSFVDIDLLVAGHHLDRAVQVLLDHGASRPWAERRPGYDRRFAKSVTATFPDQVELDVHRSLADGVHGFRIPLERLFGESVTFDLAGTRLRAPSHRHRLLHAAYHTVLGAQTPTLSSLRDLAGYLSDERLAVDDVVAEAERWRGAAVLAQAVHLVRDELDLPLERWVAWAGRDHGEAERRIVERQRREGSAMGVGKVVALRELPTMRLRAAYAYALLVPTTAHLRSRGLTRLDLLRRSSAARRPPDPPRRR